MSESWHHRPGSRANFDRVMESIDVDLPWHHKQLWIEKAIKLRDAVRRSEGVEQEGARQALQYYHQNQAHPQTSREEIMRRLRRRH